MNSKLTLPPSGPCSTGILLRMSQRSTLETARQTNWLWPTVADALDTYLRRRSRGADGYELVWRLVHIWEAVVITLACAATARFRDENRDGPDFRRCREFLHGQVWSVTDSGFRNMGSGSV